MDPHGQDMIVGDMVGLAWPAKRPFIRGVESTADGGPVKRKSTAFILSPAIAIYPKGERCIW